jgi:hypothetical protein
MTTTPVAEGVGLFTAGSTFNIPSGTDRVMTSGYRANGTGGGTYFRWSSALPSLPAVGTGENAWWFTDANGAKWYPDPANMRFDQFGTYADGTTDDFPAFKAFRSWALWARYAVTSEYASLPRVTMPFGALYSSDTWDFDFATVHLESEPGGALGGRGCSIVFAAGKTGMRIHSPITTGDTTRSQAAGAAGSIFYGIDVQTPGAGSTPADGWRLRTSCSLIGCAAWNFSRHGVNVTATSLSGGSSEGNDNLFRIEGGNFHNNGECGIFCDGADANAGTIKDVNCSANGTWGIYDSSFLGNTIIACHTDSNGLEGISGPTYAVNTAGSLCSYGGIHYWCKNPTAASTTTPGTNADVWGPLGGGGAAPGCPLWTSGKTFIRGGPYLADEASSRTLLLGCYSESNQAPSGVGGDALAVGGLHGAGVMGPQIISVGGMIRMTPYGTVVPASDRTTTQLAFGPQSPYDADQGTVAVYGRSNVSSFEQRIKVNSDGTLYFDAFNSGSTINFALFGPNAAAIAGRTVAYKPYAVELILGPLDGTSPRAITYGSAIPTGGTHAAGEIVFNNAPTAGGKVGWVCTTAGTPGTWKAFGVIDS